MSIKTIEIDDLSELPKYESYIRENCDNIKHVFKKSIYFLNENDMGGCGFYFSYSSHPFELDLKSQLQALRAINAACNTNFVLRGV